MVQYIIINPGQKQERDAGRISFLFPAPSIRKDGTRNRSRVPKHTAIIRYFTELCKEKFKTCTDWQIFKDAYRTYKHDQAECPFCHAKKLEDHSHYTRWLITIDNKYLLVIRRYKCTTCNITHALLPDIITPYSPYSLRFRLNAIAAYCQRTGSVETLCAELKIAISTLYRWLKQFKEHKALYLGVLSASKTTVLELANQLRQESDLSHILQHFFAAFGLSFWQSKRRIPIGSINTNSSQGSFP